MDLSSEFGSSRDVISGVVSDVNCGILTRIAVRVSPRLPLVEFVAVFRKDSANGVQSLVLVADVRPHWNGHAMMLRGAVSRGVEWRRRRGPHAIPRTTWSDDGKPLLSHRRGMVRGGGVIDGAVGEGIIVRIEATVAGLQGSHGSWSRALFCAQVCIRFVLYNTIPHLFLFAYLYFYGMTPSFFTDALLFHNRSSM
jgi:hypothetical protein